VLLERDKLTSGTTWHAAGLIVTFGSTSETSTEMRKYTRDLYERLEAETGQSTGFKACGFIEVASEKDRLEEYRRVSAFNRYCGVDVHEISPGQVKELFPLAKTDDLLAGFYVKEDGRANPVDLTMALAKGARMQGATILENVPALGVVTKRGAVSGVMTAYGEIECEFVVTAPACGRASSAPRTASTSPTNRRSTTTSSPTKSPASTRRSRSSKTLAPTATSAKRSAGSWWPLRAHLRAVERGRRARGLLVR